MSVLGFIILIYGDSLTQQTRNYMRDVLLFNGAAEVLYIEDYPDFVAAEEGNANGGDSAKALRFFQTQDIDNVDLVILNTGLHDMRYEPDTQNRLRQQTLEEYELNLRQIKTIVADKLIWRETFPTLIADGFARDVDDVNRYNMVARYALQDTPRITVTQIDPSQYMADGVHLLNGLQVGEELARQVISGEIFRYRQLLGGTTVVLEAPAIITLEPTQGDIVIKVGEEE